MQNNEWLITNAIGGYACGPISGIPSRRYHSYLNAALAAPYGRTNLLNYISESLIIPNQTNLPLRLLDFRLEQGLPIWKYESNGIVVERTLFFVHRQNTIHIRYELMSDHEGYTLQWHPFFHFRGSDQPVNVVNQDESYTVHSKDFQYEIECSNFPMLRIYSDVRSSYVIDFQSMDHVIYSIEAARGYESEGSLKSPGYFLIPLNPHEKNTIIVSTESWNNIFALSPQQAYQSEKIRRRNILKSAPDFTNNPTAKQLVLAADQFIITPTSRFDDIIRLQALGEEPRSVIAGFPWFTDWGRDTMISLEGLTLVTGRYKEAHSILHTFAYYIQDGLIPNMFPEGATKGIYNTADATLWFFHAINRYIQASGDHEILDFLLPKLDDIIHHHVNGTKFGIRMDEDGLLQQGQKGLQLTWMDAKVEDWVVTPRMGKAVEINALWYNALKLFEKWRGKKHEVCDLCYQSFNKQFWNREKGYLYDVIEEDKKDDALRPNQLFAISLDYPVLQPDYWKPVVDIVRKELLTPVGLRTLSPSHPDYKNTYDGDLRSRDAAYHQGTVWPWLLGPYIDAWLKVYKDDIKHPKEVLQEAQNPIHNSCFGTTAEIFDASPPYSPRGCFAQAWSVAELLRTIAKLSKL